MFPTIVEREGVANNAMAASSLKNGRATNRAGYLASAIEASEVSDQANLGVSTPKPTFITVAPSAIRGSGNGLAKCIWMYSGLAENISSACFYMQQFLEGLGCSEIDSSPFLKMTWEQSESSLTELHKVTHMYRANYTRGPEHEHNPAHVDKSYHTEDAHIFQENVRDSVGRKLFQLPITIYCSYVFQKGGAFQ